jgi:hypothetical protein
MAPELAGKVGRARTGPANNGDSPPHTETQPTATREPIGKVEAATGSVTAIRDSITVTIKVGDAVFRSDVIETGTDGLVEIVFLDGTTFRLYASSRLALEEFSCDATEIANSALFRVVRGVFGFIAGKLATTGRLVIDTPFGQIQSTAQLAGFGSLTFSILTFGLIHELKAASADIALLDNGTIDYRDLKHGIFEIITKEAHPRRIVVDDPGQTVVLRLSGSGTVSVETVANTPVQMAQYQSAYQGVHATFLQGQQDPLIQHFQQEQHANAGPTNDPTNAGNATNTASTGATGGSGTSPAVLASITTAQIIQPLQNSNLTPSNTALAITPAIDVVNTATPLLRRSSLLFHLPRLRLRPQSPRRLGSISRGQSPG